MNLNSMIFHVFDFQGERPSSGTRVKTRCGKIVPLRETIPPRLSDSRACSECMRLTRFAGVGSNIRSLLMIEYTGKT